MKFNLLSLRISLITSQLHISPLLIPQSAPHQNWLYYTQDSPCITFHSISPTPWVSLSSPPSIPTTPLLCSLIPTCPSRYASSSQKPSLDLSGWVRWPSVSPQSTLSIQTSVIYWPVMLKASVCIGFPTRLLAPQGQEACFCLCSSYLTSCVRDTQ